MICDPVYRININYKSHSTLPENLNQVQKAGPLPTSNNKESQSFGLALPSQHLHTLHPLLSLSSILCVLCQEDALRLISDYQNYIYISVFAPGTYLLYHLLTAYPSLVNPKSSQTPLSRATYSNRSSNTIFNSPNPGLLSQRKCFRIPYITCQASSKRVRF